ncbi:MAG: Na(+)-translocating NADH-quinone reductase subunit A [Methylococcales bacterium]|nr:Na(+)-translocating NADH-quinone reductase subunit A [Methylococcales bacterium]
MIKIKKGLNLPIKGEPRQFIGEAIPVTTVAIVGCDYHGIKPEMAVKVSDPVKKGQLVFSDKSMPAVRFTSPGTGFIKAIHRGKRRTLLSVVIELSGAEEVVFKSYSRDQLFDLNRQQIINQLLESGLWTALRERPFSRIANPEQIPHSIFITAMDTNPLAPAIDQILNGNEQDFETGVNLLSRLTDGAVFLCKAPETKIAELSVKNLSIQVFKGPHPSGNAGTHIHFLDPVYRGKSVWYIGLQDVIAVGKLFSNGKLYTDRIISLAGPSVKNPRLIKTRLGAAVEDLICGELVDGEHRAISGSILSGYHAIGEIAYLGRYHQQVSVLPEYRQRKLFGWLSPGLNQFSIKNIVLSKFIPGRKCNFTTSTHGDVRSILPSGNFERVMPLDIMPLFLIRALAVNDLEEAENLGCLELDEEDLALCAFVCPSKQEFGPMLRRNLALLEEEG